MKTKRKREHWQNLPRAVILKRAMQRRAILGAPKAKRKG